MLNKSQAQTVDAGATAIQANGDVAITNIGLTYENARAVALDVFQANFYQLSSMAVETAKARAQEITEDFLSKLASENPAGLSQSNDPDFQYVLFSAQREYARCGDKELEDLLVDLLVDRTKQEQRGMLQIVLNESLNTAPKLTEEQLASLALIFLFKYTQNLQVGNHDQFGSYLDKHAEPFIAKAAKGRASYQHLEFAGCGSCSLAMSALENILGQVYQGLFLTGFDANEVITRNITTALHAKFFMPCLNDPAKLQVRAVNKAQLTKMFDLDSVNDTDRTEINSLFDVGKMSDSKFGRNAWPFGPTWPIYSRCGRSRIFRTSLSRVSVWQLGMQM